MRTERAVSRVAAACAAGRGQRHGTATGARAEVVGRAPRDKAERSGKCGVRRQRQTYYSGPACSVVLAGGRAGAASLPPRAAGPPPCLPVPRERDQSSASQARHPPHWLAGWPAGGCSRRACGGRRRGRRCEDKCRALCRCAAIRAPAAGFCALCHCPLLLPAAGEGKGGPPVAGCRPGALRQGVLVGGIG